MKLRFTTLILLAVILTASLGTAALTSLSLTRTVSAGTVVADNNDNAAIKFTVEDGYASAVTIDGTTGVISFDLAGLLSGDGTGYNPSATFTFADVFTITNNSPLAISVTLTSTTGLVLVGTSTIAAGASETFGFSITNATLGAAVGGTLSIVNQ